MAFIEVPSNWKTPVYSLGAKVRVNDDGDMFVGIIIGFQWDIKRGLYYLISPIDSPHYPYAEDDTVILYESNVIGLCEPMLIAG